MPRRSNADKSLDMLKSIAMFVKKNVTDVNRVIKLFEERRIYRYDSAVKLIKELQSRSTARVNKAKDEIYIAENRQTIKEKQQTEREKTNVEFEIFRPIRTC